METLALIVSTSVVVVPLVTLRPSHDADSVSDHVKVPPVGFVRLIVLANGAVPPAVPEKLRLTGFRSMLDVGVMLLNGDVVIPPDTTRVTGTVVT